LKLAFGLRTSGRLLTFPVTLGLLTDRVTIWLWGYALGVALGWRANGLTLGASFLFTHILRAADRTDWPLAVNGAFGTRSLFTADFALWTLADGVTHRRTGRIVALPFALWMALGG